MPLKSLKKKKGDDIYHHQGFLRFSKSRKRFIDLYDLIMNIFLWCGVALAKPISVLFLFAMQIYIDYNNVPRDFALFNTALINFKTQFNFLLNQNLHKALQINGVKFYRSITKLFHTKLWDKTRGGNAKYSPTQLIGGHSAPSPLPKSPSEAECR